MERSYRNLGYVLLALAPIFIAGFWIPYFSQFPHFDVSITSAVHAHAILLFIWLALLIAQPIAIQRRAFKTHRVLGRASYGLVPLIVISAIAMVWKEYNENVAAGAKASTAGLDEFVSSTQLVLLVTVYAAAIVSIWKRDVAAHMRYMVCLALILLPPGLARVFGYWFGMSQAVSQAICFVLIDTCLIGLILLDWLHERVSRPYINVLGIYLAIEAIWLGLGCPV